MEKEINIAEILANKPKGIKLYSPACGICNIDSVEDELIKVSFYNAKNGFMSDGGGIFDKFGRLYDDAECCLFPSKSMRDWSKFAWKKGNVLVSNDGRKNIVFIEFANDTYTSFKGKYGYEASTFNENEEVLATQDYILSSCSKDLYRCTIEENLGGKLNMETLDIEPAKPKWTPNPFDKVLVRNEDRDNWSADFFSHMEEDSFVCVGAYWGQCIPYNEETAKLIGTTDNWEG